jgi:hypothetical protein
MENLKGKDLCDPGKFMRHRRLPTNSVTHPGIMELKPSVVWVGCPDPSCKKNIAIKKCDEHEFIVQKNMKQAFPNIVPDVYESKKCFDGFYMYSEFIEDGTLKKRKNDPRIDTFVHKVFLELKEIHKKIPWFRHNDLHVDNVLIKGQTPLIYDFGFANWHGNPMFDQGLKRDYGIYAGNHPMYDFHFFVNSISADLPKRFKDKALSVFPKEYIGEKSSVVKNWRLRSDVKHPNIPTMDQVIKAFSIGNNKKMIFLGSPSKPKRASPPLKARKGTVMTFSNTKTKKTTASGTAPRKSSVKLSLANKRRVSNRKAELVRGGMNNVQAELQAIRNIEILKTAGLLTPSPSPRKSPAKMMSMLRRSGAVAPKRPNASPRPNLTFTTTPQRRPRLGKKLCTSYKKDELMTLARKFGHRVNKSMSVKDICKKFASQPVAVVKYTRPTGNVAINVRKVTYPKYLKKNLYRLAKNVGLGVLTKNKKGEIVNKLYTKLNKNINSVLSTSNRKTVTARQIAEKLAKNYKWKNDRHVERVRLLKIYANRK